MTDNCDADIPGPSSVVEDLPNVLSLAIEWEKEGVLGKFLFLDHPDPIRYRAEHVVSDIRTRARMAIDDALYEKTLRARLKPESKMSLELLENVRAEVKNLARIDPDFMTEVMRRSDRAADIYHARESLKSVLDLAGTLDRAIERHMNIYDPIDVKNGVPRFPYYFILHAALGYGALTNKPAPIGRSGPFVNLLAAAWMDFGWPVPPRQTDISGWLGQQVEKHPLLRKAAS